MAWIYLSSSTVSTSSPGLAGLLSPSIPGSDRFSIVKRTATRLLCFSRASWTWTFLRHRSGTTSERLPPPTYPSPSISSTEASRARTLALRGMDAAWTASAPGFSSRSKDSLASFDRATSSWKMCLPLGHVGPTLSPRDWPRSGMTLGGTVYPLTTWARRTYVTGGSFLPEGLLPTPTAAQYGTGGNGIRKGTQKQVVSLQTMASKDLWPTPMASDFKNGKVSPATAEKNARPLREVVLREPKERDETQPLWPTPSLPGGGRGDAKNAEWKGNTAYHKETGRKIQFGLEVAVQMWPTPVTGSNRKSTKAMTPSTENGRRSGGGNSSPPGLAQAVELAEGKIPKELEPILDYPKIQEEIQKRWPTPKASDHRPGHASRAEDPRRRNLNDQVMGAPTWPTPTAVDSKASGSRNLEGSKAHKGVSLTDAVRFGNSSTPRFQTPRASDGAKGSPNQNLKGKPSLAAQAASTGNGGQLNPTWVEWLMGYQLGWTVLKAWGMPWCRRRRVKRSRD